MNATSPSSEGGSPDFAALARAVADDAGFREMAVIAGRLLGAAVAVVDRSSAVLAAVAPSPEERERLRTSGDGVLRHPLVAAGVEAGELRLFRRDGRPLDGDLLELVGALFALELVRTRSGEWGEEEEAAGFLRAVLARELTEPNLIANRAVRFGLDPARGCGAIAARLVPGDTDPEGQAAGQVLAGGLPVLRRAGAIAALIEDGDEVGIRALVAAPDDERLERVARSLASSLDDAGGREGSAAIGCSRRVTDAADLFRAGKEALLALNVAEAEGQGVLTFERTGSHRLLLSAMSENPAELEWFYDDTVAPLVAYDRQYGSDLVGTVEAFLRNDGNIGPTAEEIFTHRHTVTYRLGRVRDLCGHDVRTTDGREQLGFGLKAMRVLGLGGRDRGPGPEVPGEGSPERLEGE